MVCFAKGTYHLFPLFNFIFHMNDKLLLFLIKYVTFTLHRKHRPLLSCGGRSFVLFIGVVAVVVDGVEALEEELDSVAVVVCEGVFLFKEVVNGGSSEDASFSFIVAIGEGDRACFRETRSRSFSSSSREAPSVVVIVESVSSLLDIKVDLEDSVVEGDEDFTSAPPIIYILGMNERILYKV